MKRGPALILFLVVGGNVPLDVLAKNVDQYIESAKA